MKRMVSMTIMAIGCVWLMVTGCNCRTAPGQYNPTTKAYDTNVVADALVVTAQNTRAIALNVFDGLMTIERNNEAALITVNPAIHATAESVRKEGEKWLDELTASIEDYQRDRSSSTNWTRLKAALKVVDAALLSATKHLTEANRTAKIP